jgi:ABC-2 type transport system permease protein
MIDGFLTAIRRIFTDRVAIIFLLISPIMYSAIYPTAYTGQLASQIPIAVVDLDNSALSRKIVQRVSATQQARLVTSTASANTARSLMQKRDIHAFILIPEDYSEKIMEGESGDIIIYGNGAYLLRASAGITAIIGALTESGAAIVLEQSSVLGAPSAQPIQEIQRPLFNTREGYGSFIVPGVIMMIAHQTLLIGLATVAATMREERGHRPKTTPSRLLGMATAFFLIASATTVFFIGFVFWFNDYPRAGGAPLALFLVIMLFAMATVAAALALASFFKTRERPIQLWVTTSVPIFLLSGLTWPPEITPDWVVWLGKAFPTTPGIRAMTSLNQMGASLQDIAFDLLNLLLLTLFYSLVALIRYSDLKLPGPWRFDSKTAT